MGAHRKTGRLLRVFAVPLLLGGVLTGLGSTAASALTCQAWTGVQQPPSPGNGNNDLSGVTVITPCNAWAVGTDINGGQAQTLIEHWNGASWTVATLKASTIARFISPIPSRNKWRTRVSRGSLLGEMSSSTAYRMVLVGSALLSVDTTGPMAASR